MAVMVTPQYVLATLMVGREIDEGSMKRAQ
jgi:hypothetical protein